MEKEKVFLLVVTEVYDYNVVTRVDGWSKNRNEIQEQYNKKKKEEIDRFTEEYGEIDEDGNIDNLDANGDERWLIEESKEKDNFEIYLNGYAVDDSVYMYIKEIEI